MEFEKMAINTLKAFEPDDGYILAYSGGKDSDVILALADIANVKYKAVHNLTTVDAPETINYIKSKGIGFNFPEMSMWRLIEKKMMPPTRIARYCCMFFKENNNLGKLIITGVRKAESNNRKINGGVVKIIGKPKGTQKIADKNDTKYFISNQGGLILNDDNDNSRRTVEMCYRTRKTLVNPIVDWSDEQLFEFIKGYEMKLNPLYSCGFNRIGCIGCPLGSYQNRKKELARYPQYNKNYIKAFDRMIANRNKNQKPTSWQNGKEVMKWWLEEDPNQISLFEEE
ncbi:MAG: phosphoadenosine phosphosulfate reductase family protein [Oscillospiraceae bacterium]